MSNYDLGFNSQYVYLYGGFYVFSRSLGKVLDKVLDKSSAEMQGGDQNHFILL